MNAIVVGETLRRVVTSPAYVLFVAFLVVIGVASAQGDRPAALWPTFVTLLVFVYGSQPIGPELGSGTLQLILVKPVNRAVYLLSRVAGVLLAAWVAIGCTAAAELLARLAVPGAARSWKPLVATAVNGAVEAVLIVALVTFFGTMLRAYFNIAMYFVVDGALALGLAALRMLRHASSGVFAALGRLLAQSPFVGRSLAFVERNLYPDAPAGRFDGAFVLLALSNAALLLLAGCLVFRRREVPYGAD